MSFGGGGSKVKPPPVPAPIPVEREIGDLAEAGRREEERIRRMRGRLSTFLTSGLLSEPSVGVSKLGV